MELLNHKYINSCKNFVDSLCANNQDNEIGVYIPCEYSISTIWESHHIENKHTLHHGNDFVKRFCVPLTEHVKI